MTDELDEAMAEVRAAVDHLERALEQLEDATVTTFTVGNQTDQICVGELMDVEATLTVDYDFLHDANTTEPLDTNTFTEVTDR